MTYAQRAAAVEGILADYGIPRDDPTSIVNVTLNPYATELHLFVALGGVEYTVTESETDLHYIGHLERGGITVSVIYLVDKTEAAE